MRTTWTFNSPGQLVFGSGASAQLGQLVRELGAKRVLIVTDRNLVAAGPHETILAPLVEASLAVETFDGGLPEPSMALAEEAIEMARKSHPDAVLGLGGGSNMDLAKVVALVLTHGGSVRDHVGDGRVPGPVLPIICVPTTAGTGSEVTASGVVTDTERKLKVGILSNHLRPRLALVDPRLTLSCPAKVTADSGIDALAHAIEAYTAVDNETFPLPPGEKTVYQGRNPMGDCLAEKAIVLVGQHLVRAVKEPANLAAREGMALAATLAGLAFSNVGVALVHAMEYPLGGAVHVSHGAGNGLLLPYVMRFNLPVRIAEFGRIASLLGEDVAGLSAKEAAERAITAVEKLKAAIGIPARLRDLGVRADQLPDFAAKAIGIQRILRVNPRYPTQAEIEAIFVEAL